MTTSHGTGTDQVSPTTPANPTAVGFVAGNVGSWRVDRIDAVVGETLPAASRVSMTEGSEPNAPIVDQIWSLRGVTSNTRYAVRAEVEQLTRQQPVLSRPQATQAALIPIHKSPQWWALPQDERRAILADQSHHIALGATRIPAVARRLYHGRDLGEPFDFLAWFEFDPLHINYFEELVSQLRDTAEWQYVDREVDVRLSRTA